MAATYRRATREDVGLVLTFIRGLAEYEKLAHEVVATEETLLHHMFGLHPKSYALIAEVEGKPAGFALYFFNFSTFLGKPGIYLEDVYVKPEYRSHGIGLGFFRELAQEALRQDCGRIEWWVLDWNEPAINFYRKLGATPMTEWTVQRLTLEEIHALATQAA